MTPRRFSLGNVDYLNAVWVSFFFVAFAFGLARLGFGETQILPDIFQSIFDNAKTAFEICIGLTGVLALWMGIMRIGEQAGAVRLLTRFLTPLFQRLMPDVPRDHPAIGSVVMNMAANVLGLDNAATPLGLKAMAELQGLNPKKDTATNAQILFLVINTSSVTVLPITIFTFRAQMGAKAPTDIFIPALIATFVSTLTGFLAVAAAQRIRLWDRVILGYLALLTGSVGGLAFYFSRLSPEAMQLQSSVVSSVLIFAIIVSFIAAACFKRLNVYATFIEGAKDGFGVAIKIIPHLVAMLVAIGVFRASGAMEWILDAVRTDVAWLGLNTNFVDALPAAILRPLSGGGARAMMIEAMKTYGADSFIGRMTCVIQGSTDTTFYILAVYFGSVGISKTRHAVPCGLLADAGGILAAILVTYFFFA
ncbi:MAG TPA: nucleoside recognition domain-containing protein [Bdellovibrionota bacterium]|nr:nucleoside recognition domain-containing protein [Bdellovibrionota bacterium]